MSNILQGDRIQVAADFNDTLTLTPPQFLLDTNGNRIGVFLNIATFDQLIERLEDYEDIEWARDYTARKTAGTLQPDEQEMIPLDQAIAELEATWAQSEQRAA